MSETVAASERGRSAYSANMRVQALLVPGSLIFVNNAFTSHPVNEGHGDVVCGLRLFFVTAANGADDFLEVGAHLRASAHVVLATNF